MHDPITVTPDTTIAALQELTERYNFSGMPVTDNNKLVGIITNRDVRFVSDNSQKVAQLMTPKKHLVTVQEGATV